MRTFEPDRIQVRSAHYIGGRLLDVVGKFTVTRPSDGKPHESLPLGDAATVDAAVVNADSRLATQRLGAPRAARTGPRAASVG